MQPSHSKLTVLSGIWTLVYSEQMLFSSKYNLCKNNLYVFFSRTPLLLVGNSAIYILSYLMSSIAENYAYIFALIEYTEKILWSSTTNILNYSKRGEGER